MMKDKITAVQLRLILTITLVLIEIAGSVFIANADSVLKGYATEVSRTTADADASRDNIKTLKKVQQELLANKDAVTRASDIVAASQSYQYQDQIITDLNDYAFKAGISLLNIDFADPTPVATTPTPAQPSTTAPTPSGVKTLSVSVTIKNPVAYEKLLRFIKSIEENLTKMQISRVGLTKDTSGGGVTSEVLTLEVYVR